MLRSDKQINSQSEIDAIIEEAPVCRLGMNDGGYPYILPLNFGYGELSSGKKALFFHAAQEGKKIDLMKRDPRAAFEIDIDHRLVKSEEACKFTMKYRSVCGRGRILFFEDVAEKKSALNMVMKKYSDRADWSFPDRMLEQIAVFALEIEEMSGKKSL